MPFERLVEELNPGRSLARHPLFQVMFTLQNGRPAELALSGLRVAPYDHAAGSAKFDLFVGLIEQRAADGAGDGLAGWIEYSTDLFDRETAQALADRFVRVLAAVADDPKLPIGALDVLDPIERHRLLTRDNETGYDVDGASLPELFERQVQARPAAPAVVHGGTELSYAELNARANRLARLLAGRGSGPSPPSPSPCRGRWTCWSPSSPCSRPARPTCRSTRHTRPTGSTSCSPTPPPPRC
ncbi:condensation domain-containing protein [Kitasatospora aburaviensis]